MALEGQLYPIAYLPTATENQLGVVQVGDGLAVDSNGVASVAINEILNALTTVTNLVGNDKLLIFREGAAYLISAYTLKQFINFVDSLINWVALDNTVWDGITDEGWNNIQ